MNLQLKIAEGDESAFEEIYLRYHRKLQLFAQGFVKSAEVAEELVADVFVKLWCRREEAAQIQNLTVYLYTSVKNLALNALSYEARRFVTQSLDMVEADQENPDCSPHDLLVTSEMMQRMQLAIDQLPERCRLIFKLIREDGLKYKEVAEILNISVNTIDAQMAIAVKRLCSSLGVTRDGKKEAHLSF